MKHSPLLPSFLALLLVGCASTGSHDSPHDSDGPPAEHSDGDDDDSAAEDAKKRLDLSRKLEIAKAKLEVAQLESADFEAEHAAKVRHAQIELDLATASALTFTDAERPQRLNSARLDLQGVQDRAQEAADELAQIEIMYDGQDLDDLTSEFVVSRGRRGVARAQARLEIQKAALQTLEQHRLPHEEQEHQLRIDRAKTSLAGAMRAGEMGRMNHEIAIKRAKNEVAELEEELAELEEESQP